MDLENRMIIRPSPLRVKEEHFAAIFSVNPAPMAMTRLRDNRFVEVNEAWQDMTGYSRAEAIGHSPFDLNLWVDPAQRERLTETLRKTGAARDEVRIQLKSGEIRHALMSAEIVTMADESYLFTLAQDITEQKRIQAALLDSNKRLDLALNAANLGMWDFNPTTFSDVQFDDRWFTMLGYQPDEFPHAAETWTRLMHPDDVDPTLHLLKDHLENNRPYATAFRLKAKDGSYRWIHTIGKVTSWDDQGQPSRMVGIHLDITNLKKAEEHRIRTEAKFRQAQKLEALGTLAGGIAHDFNNILSSVLGFSELALDKSEKGTPLHDNLEEVFNAGMRARDLVKQILAFSRKAEQKLHPVQIKLIIKDAVKLLRASLPATIEIQESIHSDEAVLADAIQIHQILMNLCTNAGHAMRDGGGTLDISLRHIELDADFVEQHPDIKPGLYQLLSVSDNGHGIPANVIDKIFDPFFTTKPEDEGTGLGLSVVHGIVKSHGGTLKVYSEPGIGSTFDIYLPIIESRIAPTRKTAKPLQTGKESILYVDDEKSLVDMAKNMLEQLGYRVTTRTSSIEALELFKAKPDEFDLVITDMTMRNLTGDKLAAEMKKIRSDIPVILCSGYGEKILGARISEIGISKFVLKPFVKADFAGSIRSVLDRNPAKQKSECVVAPDDKPKRPACATPEDPVSRDHL